MTFGLRPIRFLVAPLLVALPALSGCSDSESVDNTLAIVRLNVGLLTAHFDQNGLKNCCDGAGDPTLNVRITIPATGAGATALASVTFHRSNGTPFALDPATHQLRLEPASSELTFNPLPYPSGANLPFSGNLVRNAVGVTAVTMTIVTNSGTAIFGPHQFYVCTTDRTAANGGSATSLDPAILCAT